MKSEEGFKDPCPHCGRFGHYSGGRNRLSDLVGFFAILLAVVVFLQVIGAIEVNVDTNIRMDHGATEALAEQDAWAER